MLIPHDSAGISVLYLIFDQIIAELTKIDFVLEVYTLKKISEYIKSETNFGLITLNIRYE